MVFSFGSIMGMAVGAAGPPAYKTVVFFFWRGGCHHAPAQGKAKEKTVKHCSVPKELT